MTTRSALPAALTSASVSADFNNTLFDHPIHLSSPTDTLYAQTLKHLADSLAKVSAPSEQRISRLVALCPRLPTIHTSNNIEQQQQQQTQDKAKDTAAPPSQQTATAGQSAITTRHKTHHHAVHFLSPPSSASFSSSSSPSSSSSSSSLMFPSVCLSSSWSAMERVLKGAVYGKDEHDLLQSINATKRTDIQNQDGATVQTAAVPATIAATPYPASLLSSSSDPNSPSSSLSFDLHHTLSPKAPLDDRSQSALLALGRYLTQATNTPYLTQLLLLLLRYFLSLPFLKWDTRQTNNSAPGTGVTSTAFVAATASTGTHAAPSPTTQPLHAHSYGQQGHKKDASLHHLFLSNHPACAFSADLLLLLIAIAHKQHETRTYINTGILLLLRQLILLHINSHYFTALSHSLSSNDRATLINANAVLTGLLFALGENGMQHDEFTAMELSQLLLALLNRTQTAIKRHSPLQPIQLPASPTSSSTTTTSTTPTTAATTTVITPAVHALTLRALVLLLSQHASLFSSPSLSSLFDTHVLPTSSTSYKRLNSPASPSQHYATLILTHSLYLSLLCALHTDTLKHPVINKYKEILDVCLNTKQDTEAPGSIRIMCDCVEVVRCIMIGCIELSRMYMELIPSILDICRSILLTSRRLAVHPKQRPLRSLFTATIGHIFLTELSSPATNYHTSLCRSFIQSSLSAIVKDDPYASKHDERSVAIYQRTLILLLDLITFLNHPDIYAQVLPMIIQKFSTRSRYLYLIVPQLTEIAMVIDKTKDVDSIVTLFVNIYLTRNLSSKRSSLLQQQHQQSSLSSLLSGHSVSTSTRSNNQVSSGSYLTVQRAASDAEDDSTSNTMSMSSHTGSGPFRGMPASFSHSNLHALTTQNGSNPSSNGVLPSTHSTATSSSTQTSSVDLDAMSQKLNMQEIPPALTRLAQGIKDQEKRIQMMRRMLRLFNEIAYEITHTNVHLKTSMHTANTVGMSRIESCGALLPTIASLLCPHFHHAHGSAVHTATTASPQMESTTSIASTLLTPSLCALSPHTSSASLPGPILSSVPLSSVSALSHQHSSISSIAQEHIGVHVWQSRESNVKWFRRCWYIITHFDFMSNKWKNDEWLAAIKAIAAHSPVLLITNKRDYLSTELQLEAHRFPSPYTTTAMQKYLANLLPSSISMSLDVSHLSMAHILYVSAVYHLEILRVKADSQYGFSPIFAYIADEDIKKSGLHPWMVAIAQVVFTLFVDGMQGKDSVKAKEELEKHVNFLIGKCCSRYAADRIQASIMLKNLVVRFPSLQWSTSCLTTLLTLFHTINHSIDTAVALSPPGTLSLPFSISPTSSSSSLDLPESLSLRKTIRNALAETANAWLNNAHYLVPQETLTVIQEYIQAVERSDKRSLLAASINTNPITTPTTAALTSPSFSSFSSSHAGIALTLKGGKFSSDIETGLSTLVANLSKKEQYLGEIRGIWLRWQYDKKQKQQPADGTEFGKSLSQYLLHTSNELMSEYRSLACPQCYNDDETRQTAYLSVTTRIEELIYHTAALLVFSTQEQAVAVEAQDLLHLTCKLPAQLFLSSALSAAVFAWDWILSASRHLELSLLIEMKAAWGYTVDRQIGLFSGKRADKTKEHGSRQKRSQHANPPTQHWSAALPQFSCEKHPTTQLDTFTNTTTNNTGNNQTTSAPVTLAVDSYEAIAPHIIWTRFLTIHFKYLQSFSRDVVNILAMMLHKAFARPDLWSTSPSTFGARFRLLNLGLILIQGGSLLEYRDKQLLRDRVYQVAFAWFYARPGWYDVGSVSALKEDVGVILDVRRALQSEDKFWRQDGTTPTTGNTTAGTAMNIGADRNNPTTTAASAAANLLAKKHAALDDSMYASDVSYEQRILRLSRYRDLLLFLLSHEIDRIVVWHNPGGRLTDITFTDQHLILNRTVQTSEWKQHIQTAWEIAPILAIRLSQRFPQQGILTTQLRELVQQHPESVYDISDAVVYLVHEDNVRNNIPELRNLVYWSPTSLTNALLFFNPPFCHHRMVMEYAVHTLYCHPVDQVVFYLAQIVQSLRNDNFHLLYDFLLRSSHFSILLSHQLIWLCQAELGEVKDTGRPLEMTPFRKLCQSLVEDIINNFTPAERSYYQDEFTFFEQVTAISGILKPLPTKQERKAKIKSELEKIVVKKGLYLPTSPHYQVKEIICKSGTPMQSAAKVPILVAFMAAEAELDEDWIREGGREEEIRAEEELKKLQRLQQQQLQQDGVTPPAHTADNNTLATQLRHKQEEEKVVVKYPVTVTAEDKREEEARKMEQKMLRKQQKKTAITATTGDGGAATPGVMNSHHAHGDEVSQSSVSHVSPVEDDDEADNVADQSALVSPSANGISATSSSNTQTLTNSTNTLTISSASSSPVPALFPQACIFKVGDDCRQDALALQIIQWCKTIFQLHNLPLYLYPYRVLPNRTGAEGLIGGIIECVPNAQTRDEIGKATGGSLRQYFVSKFGREENPRFQQAQRNFIMSEAAYAITSYILQVKDRHNGNLMFDSEGHVIHIDFGFIFSISPAGNWNFEKAAFKLTAEMVELMLINGEPATAAGAITTAASASSASPAARAPSASPHPTHTSVDTSPLYQWFQLLVVRGFLAVREHLHEIIALVQPMLSSSLTCFRGDSLGDLKRRFFPDKSESAAAEAMLQLIYQANGNWRTTGYDWIQSKQQGVFYHRGSREEE